MKNGGIKFSKIEESKFYSFEKKKGGGGLNSTAGWKGGLFRGAYLITRCETLRERFDFILTHTTSINFKGFVWNYTKKKKKEKWQALPGKWSL